MHQITAVSNKDLDKFQKPDSIVGDAEVLDFGDRTDFQALLDSLSCIVRDRLSSNASNTSMNGISKRPATFRKASKVGEVSPLNHLDQTLISTPVAILNALYERLKNFSLFFDSETYISFLTKLGLVSWSANSYGTMVIIPQTTKHLYHQVLCRNRYPAKDGLFFRKLYEQYTKPKGRSPSPSFVMPSHVCMGGIA